MELVISLVCHSYLEWPQWCKLASLSKVMKVWMTHWVQTYIPFLDPGRLYFFYPWAWTERQKSLAAREEQLLSSSLHRAFEWFKFSSLYPLPIQKSLTKVKLESFTSKDLYDLDLFEWTCSCPVYRSKMTWCKHLIGIFIYNNLGFQKHFTLRGPDNHCEYLKLQNCMIIYLKALSSAAPPENNNNNNDNDTLIYFRLNKNLQLEEFEIKRL